MKSVVGSGRRACVPRWAPAAGGPWGLWEFTLLLRETGMRKQ